MEKKGVLDFLSTFVRQQKSEVNYGTYKDTKRSSLLNDGLGTRANSVWKQSQFVVAYREESDNATTEAVLRGWGELTRGVFDQYLILEEPKGEWTVYDKHGNNRGDIEFLKSVPQHESYLAGAGVTMEVDASSSDNYIKYLTALRTKPFLLLAGISGTGKSRIVRKLAQATITKELQKYDGDDFDEKRWALHRPKNFELIQVKPNWHTSMDVVGFLSNIPTPHYVFTTFVEFVARAWQHPEVPFFLCLDEMNLAPVEEYFAEFLSAIESRDFDENGKYVTDPIIKPFEEFGENVCKEMINHLFPDYDASKLADGVDIKDLVLRLKEKGLCLPKNLMVIGTVNMDETTFSFSRKVLDRAMSIEMNEVDYDCFLADKTDDALKSLVESLHDGKLNNLLVNRNIKASQIAGVMSLEAQKTINYLKRINALLEDTPFKLGYRAANEAIIYVRSSQEFGRANWHVAMDEFTVMKILSRLEGDDTKLRISSDDNRLETAGINQDMIYEDGDDINITLLSAMRVIIKKEIGEMQAYQKLTSMIDQLNRNHFVSYWN